ncbi:serine/threonine-protein kinase ULK1-like [Spea bombifrons]|uniref:serine/threonine-protein kinase ULK1-like n=1 Tax=Spea bombifrons TaxID=233779 RepID=UPI002349404D|nr:serine/threonine-protein kinase ULK1-like [Spea bombifrons]
MEQEHTDTLRSLRFTLAFAQSVIEIAILKGSSVDVNASVTSEYQMQESVVADQISLLSREWSYAEQLVLYLKAAELLSSGLQTAMEQVKSGKLCLSSTVKQVVKKLNELYKSSVSSCHCLNLQLQKFFADKQKLMDRINSITAERLIFSYAVQMVRPKDTTGSLKSISLYYNLPDLQWSIFTSECRENSHQCAKLTLLLFCMSVK